VRDSFNFVYNTAAQSQNPGFIDLRCSYYEWVPTVHLGVKSLDLGGLLVPFSHANSPPLPTAPGGGEVE
jgi:hypothetical protein